MTEDRSPRQDGRLQGTGDGGREESYMNEDASEQYDRQIRLWGVDAQKRMSESRVLFSGMNGVTAEGCKNLLLAGVSATLRDDGLVQLVDVGANFLLCAQDVGKNRAEACARSAAELNRLVTVTSDTRRLEELPDTFFEAFRVIVLSGAAPTQQRRLASLCRKYGAAFYTAETFGYDGFMFCDLGNKHMYRREVGQGLGDPVEMEFPSIEEAFSAHWALLKDRWGPVPRPFVVCQILGLFQDKFGRRPLPNDADKFSALSEEVLTKNGLPMDFLGGKAGAAGVCAVASAEISPVCAILGGILGQEVIKAISGKGAPACNCLALTGMTGEAKVFRAPKRT